MTELATWPLLPIFVVTLAVICAAAEFGHQLGVRSERQVGNNIWTLEAAVLGLLALMIGFTFSMAQFRFEARREAVLHEANAIGTAALRARLLPEPQKAEALQLLRDYVAIRLDITRRVASPSEIATAVERSNAVQERLWRIAMTVAERDQSILPSGFFIMSLNQMFDSQQARISAGRNRVPNIVLLALYGITAVSMAFAGYAGALERRRWRPAVYITASLVACVVLLIQDLERPNMGFITVSQQPLVDTARSISEIKD